ncbi:hypothetical protein F5883DRAFT_224624 [Diaporthe sp. PMI_573]|nr:hypothetical protein F5883DRAFT_224624 [Diaporthaceae sp. PMI_573]
MLIFDDRFARQNRCEPPPEFPLASPYTSIVHCLLGPSVKLLLKSFREHQDRSMMRLWPAHPGAAARTAVSENF